MKRRKGTGDVALPDELTAALLESVEPVALPEGRHDLLRGRLMAAVDGERPKATVRTRDGAWEPFCPGIDAQVLHDDGESRTWLARLAPGARVPAHFHAGDEEILILEGSCLLGEEEMIRGDFQMSPRGSNHPEMFSAGGCLLLVRAPSPRAVALRP